MGIGNNQARLMTLVSRQHDLELRAQQISQTKMVNAMTTEDLAIKYSKMISAATSSSTGMVNESALNTAQVYYETESRKLASAEKLLDLELQNINTEHTAVKTEYDSTKSLITENTEKSFSLFG